MNQSLGTAQKARYIPKYDIPIKIDESPTLRLLLGAQGELKHKNMYHADNLCCEITSVNGDCSLPKRPKDMALFLGRSFRGGFDCRGRMAYSTVNNYDGEYKYSITMVNALSSSIEVDLKRSKFRSDLLQVIVDAGDVRTVNSHMKQQYDYAPLVILPRVNVNEIYAQFVDSKPNEEYDNLNVMLKRLKSIAAVHCSINNSQSYDVPLYDCLGLLDAALGQEHVIETDNDTIECCVCYPYIPPLEKSSKYYDTACNYQTFSSDLQWERRIGMISEWLESVTVSKMYYEDDLDISDLEVVYESIFDALISHQIEIAVKRAENANLWHLSMILSQLNGDENVMTLMSQQVEQWISISSGCDLIPRKLMKIYKLVAGMVVSHDVDGTGVSSICCEVTWTQSLGMLFWYTRGYTPTMSTALECMNRAVALTSDNLTPVVQYPLAPYMGSNCNHVLYNLLHVLFPTQPDVNLMINSDDEAIALVTNILQLLHPQGYTNVALDYFNSYILLTILVSFDIFSYECVASCIVREHVISQLLYTKEWKWAIFVALQITEDVSRTVIVKDILYRWVNDSSDHCALELEIENLFGIDNDGKHIYLFSV